MPNLYIANTTKQTWIFTYRLREMQSHFARQIRAGGQICLDHLDAEQVDEVVKQNVRYGMLSAKEMSRRKGYAGLSYSVGDDPINVDKMMTAYEMNDDALGAAAQERLKKTAVAMSDGIAANLNKQTGIDKEKLRPARLEMEVIEDTEGKPSVASGVEVIARPENTQPRRARAS